MKLKKKSTWITTGIVTVVVILLIILFTIMAVTSTNPKQATEGLLTNLKAGEFEKAQEFVTGDELLLDSAKEFSVEIQKSLFDRLSWKVINITEEGEHATVELEITNKDLKTIAKQVIKEAVANDSMSKDSLDNALANALNEENVQTTTSTAKLQAVKQEKKWKIEFNDELKTVLMPSIEDTINAMKAIDAINELSK